jgi:hypothetical protein
MPVFLASVVRPARLDASSMSALLVLTPAFRKRVACLTPNPATSSIRAINPDSETPSWP